MKAVVMSEDEQDWEMNRRHRQAIRQVWANMYTDIAASYRSQELALKAEIAWFNAVEKWSPRVLLTVGLLVVLCLALSKLYPS